MSSLFSYFKGNKYIIIDIEKINCIFINKFITKFIKLPINEYLNNILKEVF